MAVATKIASVLRVFSQGRSDLSVTEVAHELGIPKSSASRLLKDMHDAGLLMRAGNSLRYRVGPLLFEAGRSYRANSTLIRVAGEHIAKLSARTGHTAYISVLDGQDVLCIQVFPGRNVVTISTPIGSRVPAFETATGRSLLARLRNEEVRAIYADGLTPSSTGSPQSMSALIAQLDLIRQRGWAEAIDEAVPGVGSVAVALKDEEAGETISCCLTFWPTQVSAGERHGLVRLMKDMAREVGGTFGDDTHR